MSYVLGKEIQLLNPEIQTKLYTSTGLSKHFFLRIYINSTHFPTPQIKWDIYIHLKWNKMVSLRQESSYFFVFAP